MVCLLLPLNASGRRTAARVKGSEDLSALVAQESKSATEAAFQHSTSTALGIADVMKVSAARSLQVASAASSAASKQLELGLNAAVSWASDIGPGDYVYGTAKNAEPVRKDKDMEKHVGRSWSSGGLGGGRGGDERERNDQPTMRGNGSEGDHTSSVHEQIKEAASVFLKSVPRIHIKFRVKSLIPRLSHIAKGQIGILEARVGPGEPVGVCSLPTGSLCNWDKRNGDEADAICVSLEPAVEVMDGRVTYRTLHCIRRTEMEYIEFLGPASSDEVQSSRSSKPGLELEAAGNFVAPPTEFDGHALQAQKQAAHAKIEVKTKDDPARMGAKSPGCKKQTIISTGMTLPMKIGWSEEGLPALQRKYWLRVPKSYKPGTPMPIVFVFHGWGEQIQKYQGAYGFDALSEEEGFIAVYPEGMSDCAAGNAGAGCRCAEGQKGGQCTGAPSWNGAGTTAGEASCSYKDVTAKTCYSSCQARKGSCHPCDSTTCYDDAGFIKKVMDTLEGSLCVNRDMVYAYGCSNGGIFLHDLVQQLPGRFASIASTCGGKPHKGAALVPSQSDGLAAPVGYLMVTGKHDHRIPRSQPGDDDEWWDGYLYANESDVVDSYSTYNGCKDRSPRMYPHTKSFSNGMECQTFGDKCRHGPRGHGVRVVNCVYDGGNSYGSPDLSRLAWGFFTHYR